MSAFDVAAALGTPELPKYLKQVEQKMVAITATDNESLSRPLARLLSVRGKRLRPSLVIAATALHGREVNDEVIAAAAAIELVHIASLVHDDIIDEAATRWNVPTINANEGAGQAIVIGDYLLAKACQTAASLSAEAAGLIAQTITKLCDGQARELADVRNLDRSIDSYYKSIAGKTAALFAAACQIGGLVAGLSDTGIKVLANFGENFGLAFQIVDDLLDFISDEKAIGKPVGTDLHSGIYTLPLLLALKNSRSVYEKLIQENVQPKFVDKFVEDGFINQTIAAIQKHNRAATQALEVFGNAGSTTSMHNFPNVYYSWATDNLAASEYKNLFAST